MAGNFGWSVQSTGMGGPTADQKFYDPERVRNTYLDDDIGSWDCVCRSRIILAQSDSRIPRELSLSSRNLSKKTFHFQYVFLIHDERSAKARGFLHFRVCEVFRWFLLVKLKTRCRFRLIKFSSKRMKKIKQCFEVLSFQYSKVDYMFF